MKLSRKLTGSDHEKEPKIFLVLKLTGSDHEKEPKIFLVLSSQKFVAHVEAIIILWQLLAQSTRSGKKYSRNSPNLNIQLDIS
ncbi:CLUMA_CG004442, isoform A [Clunio marinus]|uniref:CLUMA_CG004442, isoform A n=1 Tax=Clunio marinus TaxID=568069 RepID=A0A1J1HW60_9DIPT|nr:CLUMA_CG004442, isoform A [Clunio marinus]